MYPRNKSFRDSSASSPPHSVLQDSFPLFYALFLLCVYTHWSCKKYQGRNGARYFRSSTSSNVFRGFYHAERQNSAMVLCVPWRWHLAVNSATSPTASEVFQASGWAGIYKYWSKLQLLGRDGRKHTTTICSENLLILNSQEVSRLTSQTSVCWKCHSDKQISQPQHYSSTDVTDEDDHMVLLVFVQGCSPQHNAVGPQFFSHSCTIHRHLQYMKHLGISNHNQTPKVKLQGKVLPKDPQSSG